MLDFSRIRAITLDLDDTLWPVGPTIAQAELRLQQWLQAQAPGAVSAFADLEQRKALRDRVLARWPQSAHDLSFVRIEMIRLALRLAGADSSLAEPAFAVFFAARQEVSLYADVPEALQRLARRWPILALSNGNADVQRMGIGPCFVGSHSARDAGAAKPDRRIFQSAAERLGLAPEAILHVGDDAAMDVLGGLEAGMQTAWVNRLGHAWTHDQTPHATVRNMAELSDLLQVP